MKAKGKKASNVRLEVAVVGQQGLGPLASDAIRQVIEENHMLTVARRLRSDLAQIEEELGMARQHSRNDTLALLRVLQTAASDLVDKPHAQHPDIVFLRHTTALLGRLIGQLEDLRHGLVGEMLRPVEGVAGARLKFDEVEIQDIAITLVRCFKERGETLAAAYKKVSVTLGKMGLNHRGKMVDQTVIKSWWKNRQK